MSLLLRCLLDLRTDEGTLYRKKFQTMQAGSKTNRILHVRYLSVSPHWRVFTASDNSAPSDAEMPSEDEFEDDTGYNAGKLARLDRSYLTYNPNLVMSRILRVLRRQEDHIMPHGQIVTAIVRSLVDTLPNEFLTFSVLVLGNVRSPTT